MKNNICKMFFIMGLMVVLLFGEVVNKDVKAVAASAKPIITLEFSDGSKVEWKKGQNKISIKGKKLKYIYLGYYPQSQLDENEITSEILNASYSFDGIASINGRKYKRVANWDHDHIQKVYAYFKVEPIKWRVLSYSKGKTLVLSECALDGVLFDDGNNAANLIWENSSMRKWLNDQFLYSAFNANERKMINNSKIKNLGNAYYYGEDNGNTKDKLFLLSLDEVENKKYSLITDEKRSCLMSAYAAFNSRSEYDKKTLTYFENAKDKGSWWLRTKGDWYYDEYVTFIAKDGWISTDGELCYCEEISVRPAMYINLKSIIK